MLTMTVQDSGQRIIFGIIAVSSFFGNLFFAFLILRNRRMLKTAYDMMVLNLVITDMLTGVCLVLTPNYIIGTELFSRASGVGGAVFCYLVENQYLVFTLGIVSLYTATLMAMERWYAVFRLLSYKSLFHHKKVRMYLFIVWLSSFAINSTHIIEMRYVTERSEPPGMAEQCIVHPLTGNTARKLIGVVEVSVKFFIPCLIMFVTFTQLYVFMKRSATNVIRPRSLLVLRRLTRMAAATASIMTLCWMPNQVYYLLFKFSLVELNSRWHLATVIVCMVNSCLNPCIFLLSNKVYRGNVRDMVRRCVPCRGHSLLQGIEPLKETVTLVKTSTLEAGKTFRRVRANTVRLEAYRMKESKACRRHSNKV